MSSLRPSSVSSLAVHSKASVRTRVDFPERGTEMNALSAGLALVIPANRAGRRSVLPSQPSFFSFRTRTRYGRPAHHSIVSIIGFSHFDLLQHLDDNHFRYASLSLINNALHDDRHPESR